MYVYVSAELSLFPLCSSPPLCTSLFPQLARVFFGEEGRGEGFFVLARVVGVTRDTSTRSSLVRHEPLLFSQGRLDNWPCMDVCVFVGCFQLQSREDFVRRQTFLQEFGLLFLQVTNDLRLLKSRITIATHSGNLSCTAPHNTLHVGAVAN